MSLNLIKKQMNEVIDSFKEDLRTLRPGRASSELVGTLPVTVYGNSLPIQQLASISMADSGQMLVSPWDKTTTAQIEKAIRDSQLGFSVVNEGDQIRLSLPVMSQERRLEFVKLVQQKAEAARIKLRQIRAEALQIAQKDKTAGALREDEHTRLVKDLNELIEDQNTLIKQAAEIKEKELLTA